MIAEIGLAIQPHQRRRRLQPLLEALASEAALLDFSADDVVAAVEEKLSEYGLAPS